MASEHLKRYSIKADTSYAKPAAMGMLDAVHGGQQAWGPNIKEFVNNHAQVSRPLICMVLDAPGIFQYFDNPQHYVATLKAIMETHSLTITGFNEGLQVDTDQHRVSGAGQQQQEVVDVTQEQPQPTHTFVEKAGRPIQHFLNIWIRYGLMDPHTKHPLAAILQHPTSRVPEMGPNMYGATCLYFEPDALFKGVNRAWLVTNMFPLSTGEETSQRDLGSAQNILNLDIQFSGLAQTGPAVKALAKKIMAQLQAAHADPTYDDAFMDGPSGDIEAVREHTYASEMERISKAAGSNLNIAGSNLGKSNLTADSRNDFNNSIA